MARYSRLIRSTAIFVILSLSGFIAGSLVTLHYHILASGLMVAHSHPLPDDSRRNTHKHSDHEYAVLSAESLTLEHITLGPVTDFSVVENLRGMVWCESVPVSISTTAWHNFRRGPPSNSLQTTI
jgi:hypothetical protein